MLAERLPRLTPENARADHRDMLIFLGINGAAGALLGLAVTLAILWFDIANLGSLVSRSADPALWVLLLAGPLSLTFAAAMMGSAIMLMPYARKFSEKRKT